MMKTYDMSRVHEANLTILKEIDRICRKYNIRYMLDVQQVPYEMVRWTKDETWIKVKSEDFTARYEMAPLDELVDAYEAQWNGAAKTLVSTEWSCVIENRDEEEMYIKVIRKEDSRML